MYEIWKFPLRIVGKQEVRMPAGAEILCVQIQSGTPTLWAKVTRSKKLEVRRISVIGTGESMSEEAELHYVGTVQMGRLVWHVFESK